MNWGDFFKGLMSVLTDKFLLFATALGAWILLIFPELEWIWGLEKLMDTARPYLFIYALIITIYLSALILAKGATSLWSYLKWRVGQSMINIDLREILETLEPVEHEYLLNNYSGLRSRGLYAIRTHAALRLAEKGVIEVLEDGWSNGGKARMGLSRWAEHILKEDPSLLKNRKQIEG